MGELSDESPSDGDRIDPASGSAPHKVSKALEGNNDFAQTYGQVVPNQVPLDDGVDKAFSRVTKRFDSFLLSRIFALVFILIMALWLMFDVR